MTLRKFKKIVLWFFLSLLFLIIAVWIFIETPFGQNYIIGKITARFSKDLHTKIEIKHVSISFFNKMNLEGVLIEDHNRDTLLYAGEAQVRITDWFFFKDNVELKYIGLTNAVIKTDRKDSVWNYQFLVDYFSTPSSGKKSGGTSLNIKKLDFKNITYIKKDAWLGEDMNVTFSSLDLDAKEITFSGKRVDLNSVTITDPVVQLYSYPKLKPSFTNNATASINDNDSTLKWNAAGWIVKAAQFEIKNGTFKDDKAGSTPVAWFDGRHILFNQINTSLTDLNWQKDTITAHLALQTKERSGFEVKDMKANVKLTPEEMAFNDLTIQTNNSVIRDFFRMSYHDFGDMDNFLHAVQMQGKFNDSDIDSDDIAFFAPALKTWKKNITLKGDIRGTVDDLFGKNLVIEAGHNTLLNGDISLTGLPDINQTFIDFKANDFRTTYNDAVSFVPAISQVTRPNLRKLEYLRFNGSFTGFIRDFVTYGTIHTSLGTVKSDLNMKLPQGKEPIYSGTISTDYFRLGDLISDPKIGIVSLNGSLRGNGFAESNRHADLDGKIQFVDYNGYRYNNIELKGMLDKKMFNGIASINDPEIEFTLNGLIDFNQSTPAFNFLADVQKANLKKLQLTKDDISFKGKFNLNFSGDNIDNFLGKANITEATLLRNGSPLPFDSLVISSEYVNNAKIIRASSNEFDAMLAGEFTIRDLPDAFKLFLNKYYPTYITPPRKTPENQSFTFDITTRYVDDYIKLIDSSFSGFDNAHIFGRLNTNSNELTLNTDIPQFKYKLYNFDDIQLAAKGNNDSLALSGSVSNINVSDSLTMPLTTFHITARNDSSQVRINTGSKQGIYQANVDADVLTFGNGVKIEFAPSTLIVNGKTWTIEDNGELEFRKRMPVTGQLILKESNQEVHVRSRPSDTGDWNDLVVELKKVNLGDFTPFFAPHNRIEGLVSGNVLIEDPTNNLFINSENVIIEGSRIDNDSLGNIKAKITYDGKTNLLKATGNTLDSTQSLAFDMNVFLGEDAEKQKDNQIAIKANHFSIKVLERFLGSLFSNMQGDVTGNFDLKGSFDKLQVTGKGRLRDAQLKVNYTQCTYKIIDTDIELKPTQINLDGIVLYDSTTRHNIYLSGDIQHTAFHNMFYNVRVSTRKPGTIDENDNLPVLLLDTHVNDNKQFYGYVIGKGSFSLSGYQSEMFMQIDAAASTRPGDSSTVTIPSSRNRESGIADFLVERKYGHEMEGGPIGSSASNITYNVDLTIYPSVTMRVVLDDLTGDEIKGRGRGTLNIRSGTDEKLAIHGRVDIEGGDYLFTFQSFFKKPFVLKPNTTNYITWNGDPYTAQIHFEAQYKAVRVNFAPLVAGLNIDQSFANTREDVFVNVILTDSLFKPKFNFDLDFNVNSAFKTNFAVSSAIQQMESKEDELNRQVTYLIVFNSFAPPESAGYGIGNTINELTYNTISSISGIFFNEINKKLNAELSKILGNKVSINFSGAVYNRNLLDQQRAGGFNINQGNFGVNVPISMFKDRFIVTLGSSLDVPLQNTIQQNVQFLPDVTAEWLINKSGSIRASFFYRQNLDYLTTSNTGAARTKRSGASIAYRKAFDKKRKKNKNTEPIQPGDADKVEEEKKVDGTN